MDMNNCSFTGRLTETPELKTTPSGTAMCRFSIAVNRMKPKDIDEAETDFPRFVAWRRTAEFICKYFDKGMPIALDGSLRTNSYVDKETNKRIYTTEIEVNNIYFVGSNKAKTE